MRSAYSRRTYAGFRVGDVFVGMRDNEDLFVLLSLSDLKFSVLDLRHGRVVESHLSVGYSVPSGYDVYRGGVIIDQT